MAEPYRTVKQAKSFLSLCISVYCHNDIKCDSICNEVTYNYQKSLEYFYPKQISILGYKININKTQMYSFKI